MILFIIVAVLSLSQIYNQRWQGDFWQHCASVTALSKNLQHPGHPRLNVDTPYEFYSPYSVLLGGVTKFFSFNPILVLSFAGLINLAFWFYAMIFLTTKISPARDAPFYAILFTLVMWGPNAWMYSGFLHLKIIGETLPYPSTFAIACTLLVWGIAINRNTRWINTFLIALLSSIVFLTHPVTAISLIVGLLVIAAIQIAKRSLLQPSMICIGVAFGCMLAFFWPYYPFIGVVAPGHSAGHHLSNYWMYHNIIMSVGPALLGVPLIFIRLRHDRHDLLSYMFIAFSIIYVYGFLSKYYGYGRIISQMVLILHLILADWFARKIPIVSAAVSPHSLRNIEFKFTRAVVIAMSLFFLAVGIYRFHPGRDCTYQSLIFLKDYASYNDVIITDLDNAGKVPCFGGKVLATWAEESFISDLSERREAIQTFFSPTTRDFTRWQIINKHKARFILLSLSNPSMPEDLKTQLRHYGQSVHKNKDFELIEIHS